MGILTDMIYQLPSGKCIYLSFDEYLNLTKEDIQYLISTGIGSTPSNPFYGSVIRKPRIVKDDEENYDDEDEDSLDESLDYQSDSDEIEIDRSVNLNDIPDEDSFLDNINI